MLLIDGHHRLAGAKLCRQRGIQINSVECQEFVGDEVDKVRLMLKTADGLQLTPLDRGVGYQRMVLLGKKPHEISSEIGRSESDVVIHLALMECSDYIKSLVAESKINYSYAVELTREHGDQVDAVVKAQLESATRKGKEKITRSLSEPQITPKKLRRFIQLISESTQRTKDNKVQFVLEAESAKEVIDILTLYQNKLEGISNGTGQS
ncbi:DNA-binding protein [Enterobacter asburiae]|uniref:ParB/RepB/Spo0J family partition protein n=1 Tax=Enterobacter asburiae TaxID=61645 RepID=UPI0020064778|nr:DNA-binding protein [Enterobacter asburiae]